MKLSSLRTTLVTWLAVYPVITMLLAVLEPVIADWPIPFRTLVLTAIMVPVMVIWALPAANALIWRVGRRKAAP